MAQIKMYTGTFCPYCNMAKQLLKQLGQGDHIEEINIDKHPEAFLQMQELTGRRTVPQIFIGQTHVGGFTDMHALHQKGELQALLEQD